MFRRMRRGLTLCSLAALLSSCNVATVGDRYVSTLDRQYLEERLCAGLIEFEFDYFNGDGVLQSEAYLDADGKVFSTHQEALTYRSNLFQQQLRAGVFTDRNPGGVSSDSLFCYMDLVTGKNDAARICPPQRYGLPDNYFRIHHRVSTTVSELRRFPRQHGIPADGVHVRQENPSMCWSASLVSAFRVLGVHYEQAQFVDALDRQCELGHGKNAATINQMLWAAYKVHAKGDQWLGQYNSEFYFWISPGAALQLVDASKLPFFHVGQGNMMSLHPAAMPGMPMMPPLMPPPNPVPVRQRDFSLEDTALSWVTTFSDGRPSTNGGLYLLNRTADILVALEHGYPVIAGLREGPRGHTVLITEMIARPGGRYDMSTDTVYVDERTFINSVAFIDPLQERGVDVMGGAEFLKNLKFAFAIKP